MPKTNKVVTRKIYNTSYYRSVKSQVQETQKKLSDYMKAKKNVIPLSSFLQESIKQAPLLEKRSGVNSSGIKDDDNISQPNASAADNIFLDDNSAFQNEYDAAKHVDSENSSDMEKEDELETNLSFMETLKMWALKHKLTHLALNELLKFLRSSGYSYLPLDSRTLLETPLNIDIIPMGSGEYWYNGLKTCLISSLVNRKNLPPLIELSFNIDGLPLCNSSKKEFWPILCKINNISEVCPMIVAIYSGESKPTLKQFLTPFVEEVKDLLETGIKMNGCKVNLQLKCFICDTPARSFIKGTVNFNHYHGCTRCICIGEYYRDGRHMSFPRIDLPLRTDSSFRNRIDPDHHKEDTPLEQLPIDLVADFPVADSLHLIDLGITKRCLVGWMQGSYNFRTKFSLNDINAISNLLKELNIQIPKEIHRAVRPLDSVKFWKGTEFRTFLLYLGPIVLKDFLPSDVYNHFLMLSCAIRICSCKEYLKYIDIAEKIIVEYIEIFIEIYGIDAISSNVHNLSHLIADVKRFGPLPSFSAYPFENYLYQIKKCLRHGNKPLAQVAKRVHEISKVNFSSENEVKYPFIKNGREIHLKKDFMLSTKESDKWFLTRNNQILQVMEMKMNESEIVISGSKIKSKYDFFKTPFSSSYINIYSTFYTEVYQPFECTALKDIKCKLMMLKYRNEFVFLPLIHTL